MSLLKTNKTDNTCFTERLSEGLGPYGIWSERYNKVGASLSNLFAWRMIDIHTWSKTLKSKHEPRSLRHRVLDRGESLRDGC